jgi:serine/threonine-protein kinase RsbW
METKPLLFKQMVLDSHPDAIRVVESLIDEVRRALEIREDVFGNIMVAVTEAVNNSIFHGNKEDFGKKIFLDIERESTFRLLIRIRDEGKGFDPAALPDPTAPENIEEIGGRGVFLMTHLADELSFLDEGRSVEMVFNI